MKGKNNPGKANLRVPTSEEARRIGRKGGLASAKARENKKTMRELMQTLLSLSISNEEDKNTLNEMGIDVKDQNNKMLVAVGLMKRAVTGDPRAVEMLCGIAGEIYTPPDDENEDKLNKLKDFKIEFVDASKRREDEK